MNLVRGIVASRILSSQCWLSGCNVVTCLFVVLWTAPAC